MARSVADFTADLSEGAQHALQRGAEVKRLTGRDAAENFDLAHRSEAEVFERGFAGARLNENATELSQRLDHQHAGHERSPGKMAAEKFFIPLELPHRFGGGARNKFNHFVNEAKL